MRGTSRNALRTNVFAPAVRRLSGAILELGCGREIDPDRYGPNARVTAADVSLRRVRLARAEAGNGARFIAVVAADAALLPFPDSAFDGIVASFLLCSVENVELVTRELARVAKPGAALAVLEHVRSEISLLGRVQDVITPAYRLLCNNCHLNRAPRSFLEQDGFSISEAHATTHFIPWLFLAGSCRKES